MDDITKKTGKLMFGNYAKLRPKTKNIDCELLSKSDVHDLPAPPFITKPFKTIPDLLKDDYTYNRSVFVHSYYIEKNFPTNRTSGKLLFIAIIYIEA